VRHHWAVAIQDEVLRRCQELGVKPPFRCGVGEGGLVHVEVADDDLAQVLRQEFPSVRVHRVEGRWAPNTSLGE
jgi:hypothetical protein